MKTKSKVKKNRSTSEENSVTSTAEKSKQPKKPDKKKKSKEPESRKPDPIVEQASTTPAVKKPLIPLPICILKTGDWFRSGNNRDDPPHFVGMVTHNDGNYANPMNVKVCLIEHHGKPVAENIDQWSSHTLVHRLSGPPEGYVSKAIRVVARPTRESKSKVEKVDLPNPDPWQQKLNTDSNKINVQIFDGPKTIEQIAKITNIPETRVKGHIKYWIDKCKRFSISKDGLVLFDPKKLAKKKEK